MEDRGGGQASPPATKETTLMTGSRFVLAMATAAVLAAPSLVPAADDVFVVSDVYSLRPDGACQELTDGAFGALAQQNAHWDAATKTIRLAAARNEEAAVQIVIPRTGRGFAGRMSDLKGPGAIPASRATFSALLWARDRNDKLVPDLVIPLDGSVRGIRAFDVPAVFKGTPQTDTVPGCTGLPEAGNRTGAMLFEVWVPKDAPAGVYTGTVSVLEGAAETAKLNLELTVLALTLPDAPAFAFDLLDYGLPAEGLGFKAQLNNGAIGTPATKIPEAAKAANYQVYKLAADNRCFINVLPYHGQRGSPKYAAPVAGKGAAATIMSWAEYDDLFAPILDGACNKFGQPPAHFTLPFNVNYPHLCEGEPERQFDWLPFTKTMPEKPGLNPALKEFEETHRAIAREYARHFAEKGWTKTRFEIYHNQKGDGVQAGRVGERNRLGWKLDEPVARADYQALGYLFNTAHWAFEGAAAKGVPFVTRNDIGHFHCNKLLTPEGNPAVCFKAKEYDTANAPKYLKDTTDHWVIGMPHAEGAQHLLKGYEAPGRKMMVYGTAGEYALDQHYGQFATECVRLAHMGLVGRVVYKVDIKAGDVNGPSGDFVLYNGRASLGFDGALASRRLKLWRDSVNLYDYIAAARARDAAAADKLLARMVRVGLSADKQYREQSKSRGYWVSNNVEDYATLKLKLAEIATGAKLGAGELAGFSDRFTACGSADKIVGYD
jgi:hypothetical protein